MGEDKEKELLKSALKEAIKEWMDEKFSEFGKWSFYTFVAAVFSALTYMVFSVQMGHK